MKSHQEAILNLRTTNTNNTECRNDECFLAVFLPVWMEAISLTGYFLQLSGTFMERHYGVLFLQYILDKKSLICHTSLPFIP